MQFCDSLFYDQFGGKLLKTTCAINNRDTLSHGRKKRSVAENARPENQTEIDQHQAGDSEVKSFSENDNNNSNGQAAVVKTEVRRLLFTVVDKRQKSQQNLHRKVEKNNSSGDGLGSQDANLLISKRQKGTNIFFILNVVKQVIQLFFSSF